MKSKIRQIREICVNPWLKMEKIMKNTTIFIQNKPNLSEDKIDVSPFKTSKYKTLPAGSGKKQTQFKPDTNPITERPKMSLNSTIKRYYETFPAYRAKKTNPNQTQFKADTNLWRILDIEKNSLSRTILTNSCIHCIERYILFVRIVTRLKKKLIPALKALTLKCIRKSYCPPRPKMVFALFISHEQTKKNGPENRPL
jgi:hypothetical protein